jgi:hypothetical protein
MPGGVGGVESIMAHPYPDFQTCVLNSGNATRNRLNIYRRA